MTSVTLQPVPVETASEDDEGLLVFADGRLVAVLVHLTDPIHDSDRGAWFFEAGFGRCSTNTSPIFADLDEAEIWVRAALMA